MNARIICSQALVVVGTAAMLLGAFDPLEGSLLILPGSGMVALGRCWASTRSEGFSAWPSC